MASFIGWLDHSAAEQQRTRELMRMLEDPGTVDDLGVGSIRDAISNQLFPGTSINQTRARYLLFVPWIYRHTERRNRNAVVAKGEDLERRLIPALSKSDDTRGLIGQRAGANVSLLPSTIYWSALARFGILLRSDLSLRQYGRAASQTASALEYDDELAERTASFWLREMPEAPDDFFKFEEADFHLLPEEARWLCERLIFTEPPGDRNLLGCLARQVTRDSGYELGDTLWATDLPGDVTDEIRALVHHAERFSVAAQGASLVYNLMLAEQRNADGDTERADDYREELEAWAIRAADAGIGEWASDLGPFWDTVIGPHVRIPTKLRIFVNDWAHLLVDTPLDSISDSGDARALVRDRELGHKRTQARFTNPKRLASWNGESGTSALSYRWPQIQRMFGDITDGLATEDEGLDVVA
jgi:hypothetical protein